MAEFTEEELLFSQGRLPGQEHVATAWSWSALQSAEQCPRRHQAIRVLKAVDDPPSQHLINGQRVHEMLARAVQGQSGVPDEYAWLTPFINELRAYGNLAVEKSMAFTYDLRPTGNWARNVWVRMVIDVLARQEGRPTAMIVDWKTGRPKEETDQLALMSSLLLLSDETIKQVKAVFVWLDAREFTKLTYNLTDAVKFMARMRRERLLRMAAHVPNRSWLEYEATPGYMCRFCPLIECEHNRNNGG